MKLTILILAMTLSACVRQWGKPDPPATPKQSAYRYPETRQ